MARLQGYLMCFRDPLSAIESCAQLKHNTSSVDFTGTEQATPSELKLENFLHGQS